VNPVNNCIVALLFGLLITSCAALTGCTTTVTAYTADKAIEPDSEGEQRLWSLANKFDQALEKSGSLYKDPELEEYLNNILNKLFPEFGDVMHARILKAPVLNAMALPNGSIYLNTGLLAVMENEAQLATVLAHEGEHFVQKHSAKQREHIIQAAGWGTLGGIALAGAGIPPELASLAAISSITGYSREAETESDNLGYQRLKKAGYDVRQAPQVFRHMIREVEAEEIKQPYFFSTHPKLQKRVANFESLNKSDTNGSLRVIGEKEYLDTFSQLRLKALEAKLERGQYKVLIALLSDDAANTSYGSIGAFLLGESYRLRGHEGDAELAMKAFLSAQQSGLNTAGLYKGMGLIEYKSGHIDKAAEAFVHYLKLADENEPELSFIKIYLKKIKREQHEQAD